MSTALSSAPRSRKTTYGPVDPAVPLSDVWDLDLHDEDRVVHEIEGRLNAAYDESRYLRTFDWRRNWEFANGNQWIYWNSEIPDFLPLPVPEEMRYTENQLRGTLRQSVNLLVQGDPASDVIPLNRDWDSRESARMARPLLFSYGRDFNNGRLRVQSGLDSLLFGFGIQRHYYQPAGGGVKVKYKPVTQGSEETDEIRRHRRTGEPLIESMGYAGCIKREARSPWGWFPQSGSEGPYLESMDFCHDTDWVSPAWIERAFPGIKITQEDMERQESMPYQLTQPGDTNWSLFGQSPNRRPPSGKVLMVTYYQVPAPVRGFERGKEIRICGTHVLNMTSLQTCAEEPDEQGIYEGSLPYTVFAAEPRRGTFYPRPPASDLIEPQMRINQALSQQYTHAGLLAMPNLLTTKGDHLPKVVSFGAEKWEIPQGIDDPRWLAVPPMPEWLFALKGDASAALDRVSMNFGATRGERSAQDPSGYYLDVLREHDQIDQLATVRDHARAHEQGDEMVLVLAKRFEQRERMLNIVGANGRSQFFRFVRDKLRPDKVRVVVQATSLLPYLATSRQRSVMDLADKGMFGPPGQIPPPVRRKLLGWVNLPGLFELEDIDSDDVKLAERNHSRIIDEEAVPIPPGPPEGEDPAAWQEKAKELMVSGKGLLIDPDWDPNELLPLALSRKKEDDADQWPDSVRLLFAQYVVSLKQLQQMQAQVQQKAALDQVKAQMALELEAEKGKQQAQAEGRAKVKLVEAAANALLGPDPQEIIATEAEAKLKGDLARGFADHLFTMEEQAAAPAKGDEGGKKE